VGGPRCGDIVNWGGGNKMTFAYGGGVAVYELESETKALCRSS
jgi:hypothetical protein